MKTPSPLEALRPEVSAVVEACAGSGKTWMLVSRIVRLLLAGVAPGEILAITFTRLAAREMEERLTEWLRFLALAPEAQALHFLVERGLTDSEARQALPRARCLLETYLMASPSVTLCTFDVWFMRLLRHAPLSGRLRRDSQPGKDTRRLRQQAWQALLRAHAKGGAPDSVGEALEWLFRNEGLYNTRSWVQGFAGWRAEWWAFTEGQADPVAYAHSRLGQELGVSAGQDPGEGWGPPPPVAAAVNLLAGLLGGGSATLRQMAGELALALAGPDPAVALQVLLWTKDGEVRKNILNAVTKAGGDAVAAHATLLEAVAGIRELRKEYASLILNGHLFRVGQAYLQILMDLKQAQGEADFPDVQWAVGQMLETSEQAEYLQYRLDSRFRQLLLDEFQDTSPLQWRTLQTWLSAALAAGEPPGIFLVGDPRQSIYRFRRADARLFRQAADHFRQEWGALHITLDQSRRSGPALVDWINRIFATSPEFRAVRPRHANVGPVLDRVELTEFSTEAAEAAPAASAGFRNPLTTPRRGTETSREEAEARYLAQRITDLTSEGGVDVEGEEGPRRARYGDILVLARQRVLLAPYERALRAARIPYLTRQRGGLLSTLEVNDLRQLLRLLINPHDNLALAQVLRSPIFSTQEADLINFAQAPSWWEKLQAHPDSALLERAKVTLGAWLDWAARLPVHDLLDRIFGDADLVGVYQAAVPLALRESVQANLHAFLELTLNLDSGRYPSLTRFLQELDDLEQDQEEAPDEGGLGTVGNAVRLMTIHGAKGLEAPIVWLLEPRLLKPRSESGQWFVDWRPGEEKPQHFSLVPSPGARGPARAPRLEREARLAGQERENLFYVALTRARQLLLMSGRAGGDASPWFRMGLAAEGVGVTIRRVAGPPCSKSSE